MAISKRNVLKAKVKSITPDDDDEDAEIVVELTNGIELVSKTPKELAGRMKLCPGKEVNATIVASNVMIDLCED